MNDRLRRAMMVPVPPAGPAAFERAQSRLRQASRWAAAASVAAVAMAAGWLWTGADRAALAGEVAAHVAHESSAWETTAAPTVDELQAVLKAAGLRLEAGGPAVTYAKNCWIRGHLVPHLVVQTADGPVTVMALTHEMAIGRHEFDLGGRYRGVLVPAARGSVMVLAMRAGPVDSVAIQFATNLKVNT